MEQEANNAAIDLLSDTIETGRTVRIRARGGSMRPLIPDGSVVAGSPARNIGQVVGEGAHVRVVHTTDQ